MGSGLAAARRPGMTVYFTLFVQSPLRGEGKKEARSVVIEPDRIARWPACYGRVEIQKSAMIAAPGAGIGVGVCTQTKGCG